MGCRLCKSNVIPAKAGIHLWAPAFAGVTVCLFLVGCQTPPKKHPESTQEVLGAVGSVTGALSGQAMTDEEARRAVENIQKDKEGQSAVRSLTGALDVRKTGIKYCPIDGKRFSADLDECSEHKVKLKELVE